MPLIQPLLDCSYPEAARADGVFLYDIEGKRYLDGCSGAVAASIGHGVPEIVEAMQEQASKLAFSYRLQFTNGPAEQLAAELGDAAPGDLDWVFFVNSGSEAMETALKIALQFWEEQDRKDKSGIISRSLSYHGITLGALSMSGHEARRRRFSSLLHDFPIAPPPYCYRCPLGKTYPDCDLACATELETSIRRMGPEHLAAFVAEPIIGAAGGAIVPPDGYFQRVREICDRYDLLLIIDDVMTGVGRTGKMYGIEHWNVVPDIISVGKGLSAGYSPLAATLVSDRVMQTIRDHSGVVMSGHTYSGNPLSCAVGLAVLQYLRDHELVERANRVGVTLGERLRAMAERHPIIGDVRGVGFLWGLELVEDAETHTPYSAEMEISKILRDVAQDLGLLVYPALTGADVRPGDAVMIAPPLTINGHEMDLMFELLEESLNALEEALVASGSVSTALQSEGHEIYGR